ACFCSSEPLAGSDVTAIGTVGTALHDDVYSIVGEKRFISAGIPSGNFGVQAITQFGRMQLTAIAAQQKGNVVRDQVFTFHRGLLSGRRTGARPGTARPTTRPA
ncbi:MAG: acyl-CoA dehydrogenase family protein, partial [Burkholderiales bacterium]|nr:acyl-CoA dehydrogenase family protein [Burkholderiales bacterium]